MSTPRRTAPRLPAHRGLTLIELLIALAVFSLLGVLTWRASTQLIASQSAIATELERWRHIGRAVQRIETEVLQIAAPVIPAGSSAPPPLQLLRSTDGRATELRLLTRAADGSGARPTGFRFDGERLDWLRWPDRGTRSDDSAQIERHPLLERVSAVRWRIVDHDATIALDWPPAGRPSQQLPAAIELELELPDAGTFTRYFALR